MCIGKKPEIEADEHGPEVPAAEALAQHPAGHLRQPEVETGDHRKDVDPDEHVVQMGHDEVGVGELAVERHRRRHHAGDAADHEQDDEAGREQERHR